MRSNRIINKFENRAGTDERFDSNTRRMNESRRHHGGRTDLGAWWAAGDVLQFSMSDKRRTLMHLNDESHVDGSDRGIRGHRVLNGISVRFKGCHASRTAGGPTSTHAPSPLPEPCLNPGHAIGSPAGALEHVRIRVLYTNTRNTA